MRCKKKKDTCQNNGLLDHLRQPETSQKGGDSFNGIEEVVGSIPSGSTTQLIDIGRFFVSLDILDISGACAPGVQRKSCRD